MGIIIFVAQRDNCIKEEEAAVKQAMKSVKADETKFTGKTIQRVRVYYLTVNSLHKLTRVFRLASRTVSRTVLIFEYELLEVQLLHKSLSIKSPT